MITLTVAICTLDRADSLRLTLASLAQAHTRLDNQAAASWALLVVDNGSSDHTAEVVDSFAAQLPLQRVLEPRKGLSRARNTALARFEGEWVAFTDDDAEVETDYLLAILRTIADNKAMDYFGGRSRVRWTTPCPGWLTDPELPFIKGLLCHFDEGESDHEIASHGLLPFGVNMGLRRRLVEQLSGFRTDLGPGTPARGEETEYLQRARERGMRGWYLGSVAVWHRADPARFGVRALYRHGIAKGHGHALVDAQHANLGSSRREEARQLVAALWQAIKGKGGWMRVCIVNAGIQRGLRQARAGSACRR